MSTRILHRCLSDDSLPLFWSSSLGFQAILLKFDLKCAVCILCLGFACSEITAANCGTLSFGIRMGVVFSMPDFLLWKKIKPRLAWLSTLWICEGPYVLGKVCPHWPGNVEVVLSYQEARLVMSLLHCFSSFPVLHHSYFHSVSIFWYSCNHSSTVGWQVRALMTKLNCVTWKCPNHADVAIDLEPICKTILRKLCCI